MSLKKSNLYLEFSPNKIEYYTCWDDIQSIQNALKINSNDIVLSITSAGCNVLNFLLFDPKKIIAVDYNPFQNYLVKLKIVAIKNLNYEEFLELLGIKLSNRIVEIYNSIKEELDNDSRLFWDSNIDKIKNGLIYIGEPNVKRIGKLIRFFKGKERVEGFFKCKTKREQTDYFYKNIYSVPWRLYLKIAYNKNLSRLILCYRMLNEFHFRKQKSTGQLKYIQRINYPEDHLKQIEYALTNNPINSNYFASLLLLGRYLNEDCCPPYLKKESYSILKNRIDKIQIITTSLSKILSELPDNSITKFNFSNIFDWYNEIDFKQQLIEIVRVGKNGARLFYSATRTDRCTPNNISEIQPEKELAIQLLKNDRTMLYSDFEVGNISK